MHNSSLRNPEDLESDTRESCVHIHYRPEKPKVYPIQLDVRALDDDELCDEAIWENFRELVREYIELGYSAEENRRNRRSKRTERDLEAQKRAIAAIVDSVGARWAHDKLCDTRRNQLRLVFDIDLYLPIHIASAQPVLPRLIYMSIDCPGGNATTWAFNRPLLEAYPYAYDPLQSRFVIGQPPARTEKVVKEEDLQKNSEESSNNRSDLSIAPANGAKNEPHPKQDDGDEIDNTAARAKPGKQGTDKASDRAADEDVSDSSSNVFAWNVSPTASGADGLIFCSLQIPVDVVTEAFEAKTEISGEVVVEVPLLSGLGVKLIPTADATQQELRSRLILAYGAKIDTLLEKRCFTITNHLEFDDVVLDDSRVVDIAAILHEAGFKVGDGPLPEDGNDAGLRSRNRRHLFAAEKTEGPYNLEIVLLAVGRCRNTRRSTMIEGGKTFTTNLNAGDMSLFIAGRMEGSKQRLVVSMYHIYSQLKQRFRHVESTH